jgi:hypothetical protein
MIKIEKRIIEVSKEDFIHELKNLAEIYKKIKRRAFNKDDINKEFHLKLTTSDWVLLVQQLGLEMKYAKGRNETFALLFFEDILNYKND